MATVTANPKELERFAARTAEVWWNRNSPTILNRLAQAAPIDTGDLRRSHRKTRMKPVAGGYSFKVIADTDYARTVYVGREGTVKTSTIRRGRRTIVLSATTGGSRANPWMERELRAMGFTRVVSFT